MTVSILQLVISVLTLFIYTCFGFLLRKFKLTNPDFGKALSILVIYLAQIALYMEGYISHFDSSVFIGMIQVLIISLIAHTVFYLLARVLFKRSPEDIRRVLTYGVIFSNAGYMGIPLINDVLGAEYVIYATVYLFGFNLFSYTLGRLIFTDDKKYCSVKKVFINPAVIPIMIGITIYVTGLGGKIIDLIATDSSGALVNSGVLARSLSIIMSIMRALKNMVAPLTMVIVGVRLAEIKVKEIFNDIHLYYFLLVRLLLFPFIIWVLLRPFLTFGVISNEVLSIIVILASTPTASATSMFAELYNGNGKYAGKLVAVSTLCSILTMPLVALLLYI